MGTGTFTATGDSDIISEDFVDIAIADTASFSGTIVISRRVESNSDWVALETITEADLPYNKVAEHARSRDTKAECTVYNSGTATWYIGGGKRS